MSAWRTAPDCRAAAEGMTLLYYGALPPDEEAAILRHLDACPACARDWTALRNALDALDPGAVLPGEAGVDWQELARATVARARSAEAGRPRERTAHFPVLARLAALAAAAVVAAVLLNAWLRNDARRVPAPDESGAGAPTLEALLESTHAIEDRLARQGARRYLNDSRAILVNLAGTAAPCRRADGRYDLTLEKEKSRQLLRRKNLYERDLVALSDQRVTALMRQLESVLMQVAALDDCVPARQVRELREQIEARRMLLRIDLVTRKMQGRTDVV